MPINPHAHFPCKLSDLHADGCEIRYFEDRPGLQHLRKKEVGNCISCGAPTIDHRCEYCGRGMRKEKPMPQPSMVVSAGPFTKEGARKIAKKIEEHHRGAKNARRPSFLWP